MWRLLILFAGVVLTISGCNGLLSTQFGTQRLRQLTLAELRDGVGDRDFLEIRSVPLLSNPVTLDRGSVSASIVGQLGYGTDSLESSALLLWWYADEYSAEADSGGQVGMVEVPPDGRELQELLNRSGHRLTDRPTYLHRGQAPLPWSVHGLIMLAGLAVAIGSELFFTRRSRPVHK